VSMASPPSAEATLHPSFGALGEARQAAIAARSTFFRRTHPRWLLRASVDRWDGLHQVLPTRGYCPRKKLSSGTCSRHAPSPNRFLEEQGRIKNQTLNLSVCHSVRGRRVDSGYFMAAGYLMAALPWGRTFRTRH